MQKIDYDIDDLYEITLSISNRSIARPKKIKYSNFLSACIDEKRVFTREKLWFIFKYFDTKNEYYLSREAIKESFARNGRFVPNEIIN